MSKIVLPNGSIFHEGGVSPEDEHKFYSGTVKSVLRPRRQRQSERRQQQQEQAPDRLKERQARVWNCPCGEQFKPPQIKGVPDYPICPSCGRDVSEGF
jgi:hypothetical protein